MKFTVKDLHAIKTYLNIAKEIAQFSYAQRRKVGAVIVSSTGRIIGTGYNGTPTGVENCCEQIHNDELITYDWVIHAELNAIFNATTNNLEGSTLYLTDSPCIKCASAIVQKGFKRVFYSKQYRIIDGIQFLQDHGIEVYSLTEIQMNAYSE